MKRTHLVVLATLIVGTGCAGIIGVPDLSYDPAADAGVTGPKDGDATIPVPDPTQCGGANLAEDARNCGTCGRSCGAGACSGGVCQPFLLADGIAGLGQLTLAGDSIYFAASLGSTIQRVKKDGSGAPQSLVAPSRDEPIGVATNGTTLWYTAKNGLFRCTLEPTGCTGETELTDHFLSRYVDLVGDSLVVASQNTLYRFVDTTETPVDGSGNQFAWAVAQTREWVYFTADGYGVFRRAIDGTGTTTKIAERESDLRPNFIVVDGDRFFWAYKNARSGEGIVASATHDAPANATIYTRKGVEPLGIAADARYVYWSEVGTLIGDAYSAPAGNGRLLACPRGGCAGEPIVLADKLQGGGVIVLDDGFVYFGENNNYLANGRIRAVAKP